MIDLVCVVKGYVIAHGLLFQYLIRFIGNQSLLSGKLIKQR